MKEEYVIIKKSDTASPYSEGVEILAILKNKKALIVNSRYFKKAKVITSFLLNKFFKKLVS